MSPTVKPVQMIADAIRDVSARGDIVLDLFAGSGSTLIAAHKTGRSANLCELDPLYCDRIIRRWQVFAKDDAVLAATGQSFAEVSEQRRSPSDQSAPAVGPCIGAPPALTEADSATVVPPSDTSDEHLVCWLPPFHPVLAVASTSSLCPPLQAAE